MQMRVDGPVAFRIKNKPHRLFLTAVGLDDYGMKMKTPLGESIQGLNIGETIIDPDDRLYIVKKLGMQSNVIWVEQAPDDRNLAS